MAGVGVQTRISVRIIKPVSRQQLFRNTYLTVLSYTLFFVVQFLYLTTVIYTFYQLQFTYAQWHDPVFVCFEMPMLRSIPVTTPWSNEPVPDLSLF